MSAGAPRAPITYEGVHDPTRTYLPRQICTKDGAPYLSLATSAGVVPGTDATKWLPLGGGAGQLLGVADVQLLMGNVTSDGTPVTSTGWNILDTYGAPDIALDGIDLVLADSDTPAFYQMWTQFQLTPNTNTVSSDVWSAYLTAPLLTSNFVGLGNTAHLFHPFGMMLVGSRAVTTTPTLSVRCTGGTNRQYLSGSSFYTTIARFAAP